MFVDFRDPVLGRRVAVKVLRPERESDPRAVADLCMEAQITGQLDHPNVVPVHDFGDGDSSPFIVMKYVTGKSLSELLRESRRELRSPAVLRGFVQILLKLCDALPLVNVMALTSRVNSRHARDHSGVINVEAR